MALILIEGLDRAGKTTVAKYYESKGYEYIHLKAPPKELSEPGYVGESYLDMMINIVSSAASKDIVMDRTAYGELIWPIIYDRRPHLTDEDIEILREVEDSVGTMRILMHDPNHDAHWQRCVENKEPLNKPQFVRAKSLYSSMAHKYQFMPVSLPEFLEKHPDAKQVDVNYVATEESQKQAKELLKKTTSTTTETNAYGTTVTTITVNPDGKTDEQLRLEEANAINEILSKRLIKQKGDVFNKLEQEIKVFLNNKLADLFGKASTAENNLSGEEIQFLRTLIQKAKR